MDDAWIMFSLDGYVSDDVFPDGFPFMSVQLSTVSDDDQIVYPADVMSLILVGEPHMCVRGLSL